MDGIKVYCSLKLLENSFGEMKQEMHYGKFYCSFEKLKAAVDEYMNYFSSTAHT